MKSLVGWHDLYDLLTQIRDNLDMEVFRQILRMILSNADYIIITQEIPSGHLITRLPDVALLWRLSIVREVVLSGFQLELYGPDERCFAYWYAMEVVDVHLSCLDNLTSVIQEGTPVPCIFGLCLVRLNILFSFIKILRHIVKWCIRPSF